MELSEEELRKRAERELPAAVFRIADAAVARRKLPGGITAFAARSEHANHCSEPVRLYGRRSHLDRETGEVTDEGERPYLVACGNRRASRCLSCADTYRNDARHLVLAGMRGGKGVPASVAGHPMVFLTLTAPSFGAVHRRAKAGGPCHPGSPRRLCRHGRPLSCFVQHREVDEALGEPLCERCYRYDEHVLFHAHMSELWRRTTIYAFRALARLLRTTPGELRKTVRLSFLRAVEYQARGAVHLHVAVRADGEGDEVVAPPEALTSELLLAAVIAGARAVRVSYPIRLEGIVRQARWGDQLDAVVIEGEPSSRRVARYVSGYVSKSTESSGALDRRLRSSHDVSLLQRRKMSSHTRRLVECAWRLGGRRELSHLRLRRSAHQLGYPGQVISKSRRYSTSFGALREVRHEHRLAQAERRRERRKEPVVRQPDWTT